jgi:hypothetical protein
MLFCSDSGLAAPEQNRSFQERLHTRIERYESGGKPLIGALLDILYRYRLPAGIEYVDADAVRKPLNVSLRNSTVKDALLALVQQSAEYHLDFSSGLVEVYSPRARADRSSMFNIVIRNFHVKDADPGVAGFQLFGSLSTTLRPDEGFGGSFGPVGDSRKVTLHLHNTKVYEILNTIVAQHRESLWVVGVRPENLSVFQGGLWKFFSLDDEWEPFVIEHVQRLFSSSGDTVRQF